MSSPKSILLDWAPSAHGEDLARLAQSVADAFDAVVDVLYVGPASRMAQAHAEFGTIAAGLPRLRWNDVRDDPTECFVRRALYADLTIIGQQDESAGGDPTRPADLIPSVIVGSGRPTLIIPADCPQPHAPGSRILVGWKPTREAARAVSAALPWLQRAKEVHVVNWDPGNAAPPSGLSSLTHYLRQHGVEPVKHYRYGDFPDLGADLSGLACSLDADLVVMGCYGHARIREWILGGTSRTMLADSRIPLLMVH